MTNLVFLDSKFNNFFVVLFLRNTSLCMLFIRTALTIDITQVAKMKLKIFKVGFFPALVETCAVGFCAKHLLDINYQWSFLLGFED
jgi:NhaP-type Na+/H+ or K+/H+ antiporter